MWIPVPSSFSNVSNYWTNTKTGRMVKKNSFLIISNKKNLYTLFRIKMIFSQLETMFLDQMSARNAFLGSKTADRTIRDSTTSQGQMRTWVSMTKPRWRGPLGQKLLPKKKETNYFQGSFYTNCLLKYTVWNIVGSQEIELEKHAKLRLGSVGGWRVRHHSGVCFEYERSSLHT